jgi:dipeptidase E
MRMRLFLSSYRAGRYESQLVRLLGEGARLAVITNAKDDKADEERLESVRDVLMFLEGLGFIATELDLRTYFKVSPSWPAYFGDYEAVWLAGGNTFVLRRALDAAGLTAPLTELVRQGRLGYGGESAGAIMATPSLTGVQYGDDPDILPVGYTAPTPWAGLGIIDTHLVPHFSSNWDGAAEMVVALEAEGKPYRTMTDEQAFIIDGERQELLA